MADLSSFVAALRVGGAMIYPLLLLAVIAVVVILEKAFAFSTRTRLPAPLLEVPETYAFAWDDLERRVAQLDPPRLGALVVKRSAGAGSRTPHLIVLTEDTWQAMQDPGIRRHSGVDKELV